LGRVYALPFILKRSEHMELVNGKYLIEVDDILNNSELTITDLNDTFGEQLEYWLKNLSQKTYRVMYSAYRGIHRERQRVWLDWFIQQSISRQEALRDAIIEYVRGSVYSGMDMQDYLPSNSIEERKANKGIYPPHVREILKENGLWILATVQYLDEELV